MSKVNKMIIVAALLLSCAIFTSAQADVIYVDPNAIGLDDGSSWDDAFNTVEDAIADALSGDDIWVAEGTYVPGTSTSANYSMKNGVDLYGSFVGDEDPATFNLDDRDFDANPTVLSGQVAGGRSTRIIYASGVNTTPIIIDGFEIKDAKWGIFCSVSEITLKSCIVSGCTEDGFYATGQSSTIIDCIIENNPGRGIWYNGASASTITNCVIRNNGEEGIYCSGGGMTIVNCLIDNNTKDGIYFRSPGSDDVVRNNTIVDNTNAGIKNNGALEDSPTISNSIVWGNNSGSDQMVDCTAYYSCVMGGDTDPNYHNVVADPMLVAETFSLQAGSPCIDAGDPNALNYIPGELDIDGDDRVLNTIIDIGADEFVPAVVVSRTSDFNADGKTDEIDLLELAAVWLTADGDAGYDDKYNLDGTGAIDYADFAKFAAEWLAYVKTANLDDTGFVDYVDFSIFAKSWLLAQGDSGFNDICDLNNSGNIDIDDLLSFSERWLN